MSGRHSSPNDLQPRRAAPPLPPTRKPQLLFVQSRAAQVPRCSIPACHSTARHFSYTFGAFEEADWRLQLLLRSARRLSSEITTCRVGEDEAYAEGNSNSLPVSCSLGNPNCSYAGMPFDKSLGRRVPQDKKDEIILKMVPRIRDLQNQLQEWTEWANQKVMQAACRMSKEKAELKTLRQEKDEVERLKKEKQLLEESTMKKLSEMENALCKASGQVDRANSVVRRLEVENAALRQCMEVAKLRAAESAANFQEVSKREKNFSHGKSKKNLFLEELSFEKHNVAQLQQELQQDKELQNQVELKWKSLVSDFDFLCIVLVRLEVQSDMVPHLISLHLKHNLSSHWQELNVLRKLLLRLKQSLKE